jgi:predicted nucleotidyltransferase
MDRKAQLEQELKRATDILVREYQPQRMILFGSLATGQVHEWSDIDLAIVKETSRRFIDRIGDVLQLTHPQVGFNVVVYTPQEVDQMSASDHYFWVDEIVKKGKVLYDRGAAGWRLPATIWCWPRRRWRKAFSTKCVSMPSKEWRKP